MVWSCEKGNGGRSVEISEGNESIGEKGKRKTKESLERYSEEGFGTNRSGRECGSRKMEKGHRNSDPCLTGKYGLKTIMMIMMNFIMLLFLKNLRSVNLTSNLITWLTIILIIRITYGIGVCAAQNEIILP